MCDRLAYIAENVALDGGIVGYIKRRIEDAVAQYALGWSDGDPLQVAIEIDDDPALVEVLEVDQGGDPACTAPLEFYYVARGTVWFEERGVYRDIPNYGLDPICIGQPAAIDIDVTIERLSADNDNEVCGSLRITDIFDILT